MISPPVVIGLIILMVSSAYGMVIQCRYQTQNYNFNSPESGADFNKLYSCVITGMSFDNPNIVEGITGKHYAGMNDSDVRGFCLYDCNKWGHCPYSIPKNIGHFFPNLLILFWIRSSLETVTSEALQTMPNLLSLELQWNVLQSLDSHLFQYTPKIVSFDARGNSIRQIGNHTFTGMNNLMTLKLDDNPCKVGNYDGKQNIAAAILEVPVLCSPYPYICSTASETTTITPPSLEEQCMARWIDNLGQLNAKFDDRLSLQLRRIAALEKQLGMYQ